MRSPLYLIIGEDEGKYTLQLRTNRDWLESYKIQSDRNGNLILKVPEPIIPVFSGTKEETIKCAHQLFCAVPDDFKLWRYLGDYMWSFRLDTDGVDEDDEED